MTPELRPVVGFPGYWVGDDGSVWSRWRRTAFNVIEIDETRPPQPLKLRPKAKGGYLLVDLYRDGKKRTLSVHRLILRAFVGECPPGMEGCHNNGVRTDNRATNLRWDTPENNNDDKCRHGTSNAKLTEETVLALRAGRADGKTMRALAREHNVGRSTVRDALSGRTWKRLKTPAVA